MFTEIKFNLPAVEYQGKHAMKISQIRQIEKEIINNWLCKLISNEVLNNSVNFKVVNF